jgi:hypothetical protein
MNRVYRVLDKLPSHSSEEIKTAAHQLAGMHADLSLGRLEIDGEKLTADMVREQIREIEKMDFSELDKSVNIEKPYDGSMTQDDWSRYAKVNRAELLLKQYSLLCRLRSDEPEAWEEINELFYDD